MFTKRFKIFSLLGFPVYLDLSWFVILFVLVWSLSVGYFPVVYQDLTGASYWMMGIGGALALFASVVLHELGHAVVARRYGIEMKGITLFVFGGVAEMAGEPPSAKAEFMVAVAGPIVSIALAGLFFLVSQPALPVQVHGVTAYLAFINFMLVIFNMVPAFPLDGGRVLRSILWHARDNLTWATKITSQIGAGFGVALIALGIFMLFGGNFIAAVWFFLLGMFLRGAAQMSYQQLLLRTALQGEPVYRFMQPNPITVPTTVPLDSFVRDYVYRHHHKLFPVVDNGHLLGCMTTEKLKTLPPDQWPSRTVGDAMQPCSPDNVIEDTAEVTQALNRMSEQALPRMIVVHHGELVGILALKDLMEYLTLKSELELHHGAPRSAA
jgi:Zn-dependent protease